MTFYESGKLVVQGAKAKAFIEERLRPFMAAPPSIRPRIGTDEAGKGDYFGPLVVAGVYIDATLANRLASQGIRDSKALSGEAVARAAKAIRKTAPHNVVSISPARYNSLYAEMGNLNHLLAWAHARVIENLLEKVDCDYALSDQFGDKRILEERLMQRGKTIELEQRPRAEDDLAVAAASILARDAYLVARRTFSERYAIPLPGGAGRDVVDAGKEFVDKHGTDELGMVAKLHFKTTGQIL